MILFLMLGILGNSRQQEYSKISQEFSKPLLHIKSLPEVTQFDSSNEII